jgi:2-polyprenyl-6-methoxyphenol hydroxylase-like FAD-dependent oxidoreductase
VSSSSFDLLVVGAGPAGCAAAIQAARRGLAVGIIERDRFPRSLPGEALHPDVDNLFERLGVGDVIAQAGFIKYPGWILERCGESTYMPFGEPHTLRFGFQAWRAELDSILLRHARRCGVSVFEESCAERVLTSAGRISGVRTSNL